MTMAELGRRGPATAGAVGGGSGASRARVCVEGAASHVGDSEEEARTELRQHMAAPIAGGGGR